MKKFESLRVLTKNLAKHTKEYASNITCDAKEWCDSISQSKNKNQSEKNNHKSYEIELSKESNLAEFKNPLKELKNKFDEWSDNLQFTIGASKIGLAVAIPAALGLYISGYGVMSLAGLGASVPFIAYGIFADAILYYDEMYF